MTGNGLATVPARHHVPLPGALPWRQHPRLCCAVCAAHQPLQREDLHRHLVLARLRPARLHLRLFPLDLVLDALEPDLVPQALPQAHGSAESREVRQEAVPHLWRALPATGRGARAAPRRQKLQPGGHGRDHVRAVGPLQAESR